MMITHARTLLEATAAEIPVAKQTKPRTVKQKRDAAMVSTLLHHGLREYELCGPKVRDIQRRDDVPQLANSARAASMAAPSLSRKPTARPAVEIPVALPVDLLAVPDVQHPAVVWLVHGATFDTGARTKYQLR